jgi:23S rRNA pseudouridine2605 synthase
VQKVLARAGLGSRRACEELIVAGRVTVDGAVAVLGDRVDATTQRLALDGVTVVTRTDLVYYLLNKPARVVTTAHDPEGRRTVVDLVPTQPRVFPVGRLDYDTEGLLILTNDGELAQLLSHPSHGVEKAYVAEVDSVPTRRALRDLREGVVLDDGRTAPARARVLAQNADGVALEIVIHEGRNRQVRRMCAAIGLEVRRLVRTRVGPVRDAHLAPGEWRALRPREVRALYTAASANNAGTATAPH